MVLPPKEMIKATPIVGAIGVYRDEDEEGRYQAIGGQTTSLSTYIRTGERKQKETLTISISPIAQPTS